MARPLTSEQLSDIAGYVSLSCWIVVYSPQIIENYRVKSGEGLSVTFIVLWLLGDITNLAGGMMAKLLPTMIVLAVYYTLCDILLLFQVYYYRHTRQAQTLAKTSSEPNPSETSALLPPPSSPTLSIHSLPAPPTTPQPKPLLPPYLEYPLLLLFVLSTGVLAWYFDGASDEVSIPEQPGRGGEVELEWRSQVLGWLSAVLYLGSRVPQIAHNYKTRCAGLSLAMFFFSISGNITYVASILLVSMQPRYLVANASWLAGSGLTVFLDLFVLAQFGYFNWQDRRQEEESKVFADGDSEASVGEERA